MSPVRLDFTKVETLDTSPVPAGTYEATVQGCKPKTSSNGNPMLEWAFNIEHPDYQGRRVFTNAVLTPNALWKLKQILQGLGYTEDELAGEMEFDPSDVVGLSCGVVVTQREYQGTMRNDVQRVIPVDEVVPSFESNGSGPDDLPEWAQDTEEEVSFYSEDEETTPEEDGYTFSEEATTAAINLAEEHDVDLDQLQGSGAGGKITKSDVQEYIDARENANSE